MLSLKNFYLVGGILMLVATLGAIYNLYLIWEDVTLGFKISNFAGSILFQALIAIFFLGLYKITPSASNQVVDNKNLDELVKNLQNKNLSKNKNAKK